MELPIIKTVTGSILRETIRDVLDGAGLAILRGPAGIGKSFALNLITEDLEAEGAMVVRVTASPATGGSINSFMQAVLSQYGKESTSQAAGVEQVGELLRGYPFRDGGRRVVFIVDEAQEMKAAVLETIRSLWDRGDDAREGYHTEPAFGWVLVGNETFMGKGGSAQGANFRPLLTRVTASLLLPRPNKKEVAALAAALFPGQADLIRELEDLGAGTGNLRSLSVAARQSRLAAKGEAVTLDLLRRIIRMMGGK